jgi:hypothetical protein
MPEYFDDPEIFNWTINFDPENKRQALILLNLKFAVYLIMLD